MRWFDNRTTGGKVLVIGLISLGLMIPLAMLRSLISERQGMREQASATVTQGWGGEVVGGGPVLRVPVQSESRRTDGQVVHEVHQQYLLPERLEVVAQLSQAPPRHVGIYSVPVFTVHLKVSGSFRASDLRAAAEPGTTYSVPFSSSVSTKGIQSLKVVPRPSSLCRSILPPWAFMMRSTIIRPSPRTACTVWSPNRKSPPAFSLLFAIASSNCESEISYCRSRSGSG